MQRPDGTVDNRRQTRRTDRQTDDEEGKTEKITHGTGTNKDDIRTGTLAPTGARDWGGSGWTSLSGK